MKHRFEKSNLAEVEDGSFLQEIKKGDSSDFLEINICLTRALPVDDPRLTVTNVSPFTSDMPPVHLMRKPQNHRIISLAISIEVSETSVCAQL